jgi:DNA-binding transcriptional regulator YhcF (GntR family)
VVQPLALDPDSPVPRYHQIAEAIRAEIATGRLSGGDLLAPLRQAADAWGVNLHTVRHAYAELARQGLVESRRAVGTRVRPGAMELLRRTAGHRPESPADFVERVAAEALQRFGMPARELAGALAALPDSGPGTAGRAAGYVVECSQTQCEDLARQIETFWDVDAHPWCLREHGEPPPGPIIATYFHYNEIRRRWPDRLPGVRFASITVDPELARQVRRQAGTGRSGGKIPVDLYELDQPTLDAVRADLSLVLPASRFWLRPVLIAEPGEALAAGPDRVALVAPRVWGELTPAQRGSGRVLEVRYRFAGPELAAIGRALRWPRRHG